MVDIRDLSRLPKKTTVPKMIIIERLEMVFVDKITIMNNGKISVAGNGIYKLIIVSYN